MKFGFELELFCRTPLKDDKGGDVCLVPTDLPYDECGWLVEVRSEPHSDVRKAIALLNAELEAVTEQATKANIILVQQPLMEVPRALKVQAARKHGKGLINYRNIYGHETHHNSTKLQTASLHISFTNEVDWHYTAHVNNSSKGESKVHKYNGFVDHAKLIVGLDRAFAAEIKAAKRNPGFYEVKADGRIEYRSLPNNVDLNKVREVLEKLTK